MALSHSLRRDAKLFILTILGISLLELGIFLYFGEITLPYLSPVVVVIGDHLAPFTTLIDPALVYVNLTQWFHPASNAYRATLKGRKYVAGLICQCMGSLMTVYCVLLKFPWVLEKVYGLKVGEGMCVGPCWKLWTELVLLVGVGFAVLVGWELDGGLYRRFMDRQVEKLKRKDAEKAAKGMLAAGGDLETSYSKLSVTVK